MNAFYRDLPGIVLSVLCALAVYCLPQYAASLYVQGAVFYLFNAMRIDVAMAHQRLSSSTTMSVVLAAIWPLLYLLYFIHLTWDILVRFARLLARPFKRA